MPFTGAHPAAVIPLAKVLGRRRSISALVTGSVVPDLAYFLPWAAIAPASHTLVGLVAFCLPAGIAIYYVYHLLLAPLVFELAPRPIRTRLPERMRSGALPAEPAGAVGASLCVGAATHLVWDAFTHAHGAAVVAIPILATPLVDLAGYTVHVYKLLQHGSTILGLACLGAWALRLARATPARAAEPTARASTRAWPALALSAPALGVGVSAASASVVSEAPVGLGLQRAIGAAVFASGAVLLPSLIVAGGIWRVVRAVREPQRRS